MSAARPTPPIPAGEPLRGAARSFVTQQQVRFGDVDPAGIVFYPRIFDFVHQAFEELWDVHVGERYYYLIREKRIGFPLVHSEVDFQSPLYFGDRPIVRITCFRLGTTSLGLRYRYLMDERLCLEARMTTVCVALDGLEKFPIDENYRAKFAEILESEPGTSPKPEVGP
jgi:4-hydroxybenzoyl-CoA thioesterase